MSNNKLFVDSIRVKRDELLFPAKRERRQVKGLSRKIGEHGALMKIGSNGVARLSVLSLYILLQRVSLLYVLCYDFMHLSFCCAM